MKIFNNTLNYVKNVTFFDNIKIVNTLLFEHIQHFDEFYKEIKKSKRNCLYSIRYKKRKKYVITLEKTIKASIGIPFYKALSLTENTLLIEASHFPYTYDIETNKSEKLTFKNNNFIFGGFHYLPLSKKVLVNNYYSIYILEPKILAFKYYYFYEIVCFCECQVNQIAVLYIKSYQQNVKLSLLTFVFSDYMDKIGKVKQNFQKIEEIEHIQFNYDFAAKSIIYDSKKDHLLVLDDRNKIISIDIKAKTKTIVLSFKEPINKCIKISDELFSLESNRNSIIIFSFNSFNRIKEYNNMQCSLFLSLNDNHFRILVENNNIIYLLNKHNGTIKGVLRISQENSIKNLFLYDDTHLATVEENIISIYKIKLNIT